MEWPHLYLMSEWHEGADPKFKEVNLEFTDKHERTLNEAHDAIIKVQTILTGTNGSLGLVKMVEDTCGRITKLEDRQDTMETKFAEALAKEKLINYQERNKIKLVLYWLIGILAGSGIITGISIGVKELISGG